MKTRIFFILLSLLFNYSCQQGEANIDKEKDKKLMSKELLISIFEELVLIESHLQSKYFVYSNYEESLNLSRDSLLKSKGCTIQQFNDSFDYYSKSDKELLSLYQKILNDFNEKSARATAKSN
ncbi:MAG: DUF4296 domain-containing protein [Bacteroidetes bacterium]|nr:DUF4296 domain-containing protein [Bacteroidota bacterium]